MKKIFILFIAVLQFGYTSTQSQQERKLYHYTFEMIGVKDSSEMIYQDSILDAMFVFTLEEIVIKIDNKSNEPFRIIWDETSFIDGTNAEKIMHNSIRYSERYNSQSPTLIPPGASINDQITPVDNVRFSTVTEDWVTDPLFPFSDGGNPEIRNEIIALKGHPFSIYMPLQRGNITLNYHWKFKITDVRVR